MDSLLKYIVTPIDEILNCGSALSDAVTTQPESAIERATELFHAAAQKVPAYRSFLEENDIKDASSVSFLDAPFTTKENYFHKHSLESRCYGGSLANADFIHQSSGSSGKPTYWARSLADEVSVTARFEQIFHDNFHAQVHSTLAVICFPLGSWVGGMFTTTCCRHLTSKGYKVLTVTPGNKMPDILQAVQDLGPKFDQTVLLGYPPFIKGVIDAGIAQGIDWSPFSIKLVLAGEVFSEEWRSLMLQRAACRDPLTDVVSIYGTADAGVIAVETALSSAIRSWLARNPQHVRELFGRARLPSLLQYDPHSRLLEAHPGDGSLVVSSVGALPGSGAPLLRYCIGDAGGVMSFKDMLAALIARGFDSPLLDAVEQAANGHISSGAHTLRRQPFVWVFGRSFWCVSVYGANVWVDNVMVGLEQREVAEQVTGKFVLYVHQGADLDSRLALRVELAPGVAACDELRQRVAESVLRQLLRCNSEYGSYVPAEQQLPLVSLHAAADPEHFPAGVKHSYVQ